MASLISQVGVVDGQIVYAEHILRIINALSGLDNNDIFIAGDLNNTGSFTQFGTSSFSGESFKISSSFFILPSSVPNNDALSRVLVIDPTSGRISYRSDSSLTGSGGSNSGSFSGSFQGDGSQLTGIGGGSSKWTGSGDISRLGNVSVTGSLRITSALTSSIISASSGITGSLFGTASFALNAQSASIASTASYIILAQTSSTSVSASISQTSSFARSGNGFFTGSFTGSLTGSLIGTASFTTSASISAIATSARGGSGSFSGSFQGDGSALTGIVSSKWTGSSDISRLGNVTITGSLIIGENNWVQPNGFGHAEGQFTSASNGYTHAEGILTLATGAYSHAEGQSTIARGTGAHAEGVQNYASGAYSHAEGSNNIAIGQASHVGGYFNTSSGDYSTVVGAFNRPNTSSYSFIIGGGNNTSERRNLLFASHSIIVISGSLTITSGSASGSFSGSFVGDGSGLTGIGGGSSKWTGSGDISRLGNVSVTGSLNVSSSGAGFNTIGTSLFTGPITASIISGSKILVASLTASEGIIASLITGGIITATELYAGPIVATTVLANSFTGSLLGTASFAVSASWAPNSGVSNSGSFSGSFQGDGSQLTGIGAGSSKWTGSTNISRLGNVQVTGSFEVSGSGGNIIGATLFTGPITASIISGSNITGSLFGTSSWAINSSQSISSSVAISSSRATFAISSSYATSSANAQTASFSVTASMARAGSGSFSGSFQGDGSQLTGIAGGSSKWTGSSNISRLGNVSISGSFEVSGSGGNILGASQFTGAVTASIISASNIIVYNLTASNDMLINNMSGNIITSNELYTGPIIASTVFATSFTGSLLGTASFSTFTITSRYATSASISQISTLARGGSGSFSGSFRGDGSALTGIAGGSSKWTGSSDISRLGNVQVSGSFTVTGSSQVNILGATQFTGPVTASIISGSAVTGSLFGTASFAVTASYAFNTINPAVNSDQRYFESTDFAGTTTGDLGIVLNGAQLGGGTVFSDQYGQGTSENVLGVYRIFTGTSTSGSGWMNKGYSGGFGNAYLFGRGNALTGRWRIAISNSLSSSINDIWTASIGFIDNPFNTSYGAYFRWSPTENSGRWRAIIQKGLTSSSIDTGIVPNTSYSIFQIESNTSGTAVTFSIDSVLVASGSSNISTGSGESFAWWVSSKKSSGSQDRGLAIDWYSLGLTRNEPR